MTDKQTLKKWFRTGEKPTQAQFGEWLDSYHHKDEKIPAKSVEGLQQLIENTPSVNQLQNHQSDPMAHSEIFNLKVDKEDGRGLSSNDFTNELKQKLEGINLQTKVDKEDGKRLSSNDFTDAYKQQLDELAEQEPTEINTENFHLKNEKITLVAGTNTNAPLNFQSGNLTYTPRNGQMEYSENGLFFTHANQRRQMVLIDQTELTTEQIAQKLKVMVTGERYLVKFNNQTMENLTYEALLEAAKSNDIDSITIDNTGLSTYSSLYTNIAQTIRRPTSAVIEKLKLVEEKFGLSFDVYDLNTKDLVASSKVYLNEFIDELKTGDTPITIRKPENLLHYYIVVRKIGEFKNYSVLLVGTNSKWASKDFRTTYGNYTDYGVKFYQKLNDSDNELILYSGGTFGDANIYPYGERGIEAIGINPKYINLHLDDCKIVTITNIFINDVAYKDIKPNVSIYLRLTNDYISGSTYENGRYRNHSFAVGAKFPISNTDNISIDILSNDKAKGFYKIQLINSENQEVKFEHNALQNKGYISVIGADIPSLLTIKLWSYDSLDN